MERHFHRASQPISAAPPHSAAQNRIHSLDGLRAIAVLLVVAHHAGAATASVFLRAHHWTFLANLLHSVTASGVELFFVLSGVVLLRPYFRSSRPFMLKTYLLRRIQRLWPPFVVAWIISGLVVLFCTHFPTWYWQQPAPQLGWDVWASQLGIVYFGHQPYNIAWWSLTVEIFFYL